MKCIMCGKEFSVLNIRGGNNRKFCYECVPFEKNKQDRNNQKRKILTKYSEELKIKLGCCRCGYNKCSHALEWHHIDNTKDLEPANVSQHNLKRYLEEISKCILLCSNCHREEHYKK